MNSVPEAFADDDPLLVEAADWLLKLSEENVPADTIVRWQEWLLSSPVHREAFERAQSIWEAVPAMKSLPWPTDMEAAGDNYDASVPVAAFKGATPASFVRKTKNARLFAMAATVVLAIGLTVAWLGRREAAAPVLQTSIGENRAFTLADGSTVLLGGASQLRLTITAQRRALELERGEAFFDVAKDPRRPFVVTAGQARITALGTSFNVRRAADRLQIDVTSGAVKVTPNTPAHLLKGREMRLDAGEHTVVAAGTVLPAAPSAAAMVLPRREGRLQYTSEPLRYVVADLERYSNVPIEIEGAHTGELLVTGTVLESDPQGWLQGLGEALPVAVSFEKDRIAIRPARQP